MPNQKMYNKQVNEIVFQWENVFEGTLNRWTQGEIHRRFLNWAYAECENVKQVNEMIFYWEDFFGGNTQ